MPGTDFGKLAKNLRGGQSATAKEMRDTPPRITVIRRPNRKGILGNVKIVRLAVGALNARQLLVTHNGNLVGYLQRENEQLQFDGLNGVNVIGVGVTLEKQKTISLELENGMRRRFFCG